MADKAADKKVSEADVIEHNGRKHRRVEEMPSEDVAEAYKDAVRLRAHELSSLLDQMLGGWLRDARDVLGKRGHLGLIREFLAVYYDPTRKQPVFGPGASLVSQGAIERAIAPRALKSAG